MVENVNLPDMMVVDIWRKEGSLILNQERETEKWGRHLMSVVRNYREGIFFLPGGVVHKGESVGLQDNHILVEMIDMCQCSHWGCVHNIVHSVKTTVVGALSSWSTFVWYHNRGPGWLTLLCCVSAGHALLVVHKCKWAVRIFEFNFEKEEGKKGTHCIMCISELNLKTKKVHIKERWCIRCEKSLLFNHFGLWSDTYSVIHLYCITFVLECSLDVCMLVVTVIVKIETNEREIYQVKTHTKLM